MTEPPCVAAFGVAPTEVCDDTLLTTSDVDPVEPANVLSPEYVPVIVSVPAGAADELHEPPPPDNVAMQRGVEPVVNVTVPPGVPPTLDVTVAEYRTEVPTVTGLRLPTAVCDGSLTTRLVFPSDAAKLVSPEYAPEIGSVPTGAADEVHVPLPFDNVAMHSGVDPVVNVTVPVGVGNPATFVVTFAE